MVLHCIARVVVEASVRRLSFISHIRAALSRNTPYIVGLYIHIHICYTYTYTYTYVQSAHISMDRIRTRTRSIHEVRTSHFMMIGAHNIIVQ